MYAEGSARQKILKFSHVFAKLEVECSVRALFVAQIWTVTNLGLVQIYNG
jgi:hypothetical protein